MDTTMEHEPVRLDDEDFTARRAEDAKMYYTRDSRSQALVVVTGVLALIVLGIGAWVCISLMGQPL